MESTITYEMLKNARKYVPARKKLIQIWDSKLALLVQGRHLNVTGNSYIKCLLQGSATIKILDNRKDYIYTICYKYAYYIYIYIHTMLYKQ